MRLRFLNLLFLGVLLSCKAKDSNPGAVEDELNNAMRAHLYSAVHNDSSKVKYNIEKTIYFEDADKYICEFTVSVHAASFDTTGIMKANISKDFKTVKRSQ